MVFLFERVAQFNLEWIFSKLDSGFQSLVGFRILSAGFRIPKPRIPESGFPYMGRKWALHQQLTPKNPLSNFRILKNFHYGL